MRCMKFEGIVDCSNEEYHGERNHLSSSNLKLLLKDPELFYEQKIKGNLKPVSITTQNAFDEGSLAHTLILEPHLVSKEYKFFSGFRKQGREWEDFKLKYKNSSYVLMSMSQKSKVENWVSGYKKLPAATSLIKNGKPEHTLFGSLMGVPVKVRADYINIEDGYIVDVKTTSNPTDLDSFKYTVKSFEYDLSAALYSMMFEQYYGKQFKFYFIVLGKRDNSCEVFSMSETSRKLGEGKVVRALKKYKECKKSGIWKLKEINNNDMLKDDDGYEILEV